jgi:Ca2+-binding RTX toxin-like protein
MAGYGNDTLIGLAGNDTFTFKTGFGLDIVNDFAAGSGLGDVIKIEDGLFADYAAILAATTQVGSDATIAFDVNNRITLKNVAVSALHENDFAFG